MRHLHCVRVEGGSLDDARAIAAHHAQQLPPDRVLVIDCDRDPSTLLDGLLETGTAPATLRASRRGGTLTLLGAAIRPLIDLTDLEAPLPLERVLEHASALAPGEALAARTPCFPQPLFSLLDRRGLDWEALEDVDESAIVWVGRPD